MPNGVLVHKSGACWEAAQRAKFDALRDIMKDDVVFNNIFHGLFDAHYDTPKNRGTTGTSSQGMGLKRRQGTGLK
ncbi:MAG: hypothetical protein KDA91_23810 [Planctomycetaceae bacterium]|nr:hypothetical protein [Planctomycetaceae bacterium]